MQLNSIVLMFTDANKTDVRPLSDEERARLRINLPHLHKSIEPEPLIDHLFQKHCINDWQKQHLHVPRGSIDTNKELVNILIKRSFTNFKEFISILTDTGQSHVAKVIGQRGGLFVMLIVIIVSLSSMFTWSREPMLSRDRMRIRHIRRISH